MRRIRSNARKAMTLLELNIAILIASLFVILTMTSLVVGTRIIRTVSEETKLREQSAWMIRDIINDVRHASAVEVFTNHDAISSGVDSPYGSCIVVTDTKSTPGVTTQRAWYYAAGSDDHTGGLYRDDDLSTPPDPSSDERISGMVLDFDARWDSTGTLRLAVIANARPFRAFGDAEAEGNRLQIEASVIPREL